MTSSWAREPSEEPAVDRFTAKWADVDARRRHRESVRHTGSVPLRLRESRESEDDARAEFVGAYLDRAI